MTAPLLHAETIYKLAGKATSLATSETIYNGYPLRSDAPILREASGGQNFSLRPRMSLMMLRSPLPARLIPYPKFTSQSGDRFKSIAGKSTCCC